MYKYNSITPSMTASVFTPTFSLLLPLRALTPSWPQMASMPVSSSLSSHSWKKICINQIEQGKVRAPGCFVFFFGDGILASYVGIATDQYKDPYQSTSRMESKSIFCRAQLARSRAALKTPLCQGAVINSLCWGW